MISPAIEIDGAKVFHGNNLDVLPLLADNSVDSIVTDPPYELGFMGKKWDSTGIAYSVELWAECLRVLKPGGHLLAFSGSRTYHRMAVAIDDAGFEVRDMIAWVSNKTFPKSLDIGKAIAKMDAADEAKRWQGWGTALKPTVEPVIMARKPLTGTVAANVLEYGTGGLNIDGTRIGSEVIVTTNGRGFAGSFDGGVNTNGGATHVGRWPANVAFDDAAAEELERQEPGASRFFYVARAGKRDRSEGLEDLPNVAHRRYGDRGAGPLPHQTAQAEIVDRNFHPTVKPTDLMRYLVKLVTPPGGVVLDPFTGSGSTGKAAILDGFRFIGIELTDDYLPIIAGRLQHATDTRQAEQILAEVENQNTLFNLEDNDAVR